MADDYFDINVPLSDEEEDQVDDEEAFDFDEIIKEDTNTSSKQETSSFGSSNTNSNTNGNNTNDTNDNFMNDIPDFQPSYNTSSSNSNNSNYYTNNYDNSQQNTYSKAEDYIRGMYPGVGQQTNIKSKENIVNDILKYRENLSQAYVNIDETFPKEIYKRDELLKLSDIRLDNIYKSIRNYSEKSNFSESIKIIILLLSKISSKIFNGKRMILGHRPDLSSLQNTMRLQLADLNPEIYEISSFIIGNRKMNPFVSVGIRLLPSVVLAALSSEKDDSYSFTNKMNN